MTCATPHTGRFGAPFPPCGGVARELGRSSPTYPPAGPKPPEGIFGSHTESGRFHWRATRDGRADPTRSQAPRSAGGSPGRLPSPGCPPERGVCNFSN
jgi:hypothetical protein